MTTATCRQAVLGVLEGRAGNPARARPDTWNDPQWTAYLDGRQHGHATALGRAGRYGDPETIDGINEAALMTDLGETSPTDAGNAGHRLLLIDSYTDGLEAARS